MGTSLFSLLQTVSSAVATGTRTATLTTPARPGSLIVVFSVGSNANDTLTAVSDDAGNTYTSAYSTITNTQNSCHYAIVTKSCTVITVTYSGTANSHILYVREYTGIQNGTLTLDRTKTATGTATAVTTGATASATLEANELVVSSTGFQITSGSLTVGATYGNFINAACTTTANIGIEDKTVTTIGTQTGTMTASSSGGGWDTGVATFIQAPGKVVLAGQMNINSLKPHVRSPGNAR